MEALVDGVIKDRYWLPSLREHFPRRQVNFRDPDLLAKAEKAWTCLCARVCVCVLGERRGGGEVAFAPPPSSRWLHHT